MDNTRNNGSRDGYFRIPIDFGNAAAAADAAPAQNVSVSDAAEGDPDFVPADRVRVEPEGAQGAFAREVPGMQKAKGVAQMAGGAALVAVGVPLCVLPGPGVAALAGGAALASRGQRNYSGRAPLPVEEKLDEAAAKLAAAAKGQAAQAARTAADKAPEVVRSVAARAPEAAERAVHTVAENAPKVAAAVVKGAPVVAQTTVRAAKTGAGAVARAAASVVRAGTRHARGEKAPRR